MLKKVILAIISLSLAQYIAADTIAVRSDHPEQYTVVKGDTLWDITGRFIADPWHWPEVWQRNPHIENPHLIYPGDIVSLSYQGAQPVLTVQPGVAKDSASYEESQRKAAHASDTDASKVTLFPKIRTKERPTAVLPLISFDAVKHFLEYPRIFHKGYLAQLPYVLSMVEGRLTAATGDKIYARGFFSSSYENKKNFLIYRKGEAYRDPEDRKTILGYEAVYVGNATVKAGGDPATLVITSADREVRAGDRLIAEASSDADRSFKPVLPVYPVKGRVVSIYDGKLQAYTYMVLALNMGEEDGLEIGDVLGVYQSGTVVDDRFARTNSRWENQPERVTLPEKKVGTVMVFKILDRFSYGLILSSTSRIYALDTVKNL